MTYRELKETLKKHPNYSWTKEQRSKRFEYKLNCWVEQKNREYDKKYL